MAEIKIRIGSEVNGAISGLQQVQTQMTKTGQVSQVMTKQLGNIPRTSNAATQSLINLSRVAQDAPYGFIGIANNLNPLLESFQRLKVESGSTRGALKTLASSLTGAGGIGLALGVVSSLLITFGDRIFGAGKKAKEASDGIKELLKPLREIETSVKANAIGDTIAEISKVQALSAAVQDQSKSYKERNNALIQLKEINKNYFGDLSLEESKLGTLKKAVDEYTNALVAQAVVKGFTDEISKVSVELSKQKDKYDELKKATEGFGEAGRKSGAKTFVATGAINNQFGELTRQQNSANDALTKQGVVVSSLQGQYDKLFEKIGLAVNETLKFKPLVVPAGSSGEFDKFINATIAKAKEFEKQFGELNLFPKLEVDFTTTKEDVFRNALKVLKDFSTQGKALTATFRIQPIFDKIEKIELPPEFSKEVTDKFKEAQSRLGSIKPVSIPIDIDVEKAKQHLLDLQANAQQAAGIIAGTLGPAFEGLFDAVASGADILEGFFSALKNSINQLIKRLITAAVEAAILSALTQGSGNPLSFLSAFKSVLGFRAFGGPVQAGRPYVVGERKAELFVPNVSGRIVPNLNGLRSEGVNNGGEVIFRIGGNELVGVLTRSNQSQRRLA